MIPFVCHFFCFLCIKEHFTPNLFVHVHKKY